MSQINVNTIAPQSGSSVTFSSNVSATDVTGSFGRIEGNSVSLTGDLIAHRYLVSSSITNVVIATNSGSSAFGDTLDDVHRFTGSLELTGSVSASKFIGDGALLKNVFEGTTPSASISTRLTSFTDGSVSLVSGSVSSTGSFGDLRVAGVSKFTGNVGIGENAPAFALEIGTGKSMMARTYVIGDASTSNKLHLPSGNNVALNSYDQLHLTTNDEGSVDSSILFKPRGTTRMAISASGNVGIGTTTPGAALEVIGNISGSVTSTGSFGAGYIDNKLGIGTTHPDVPLDVTASPGEYVQYWQDGTVQMTVYLSGSPYGWFGTRTNHDLRIGTNDSARIAIEAGGDVGIGTNNPSHKLDVNGTFRTVGAATFDSTIGSGAITSTGNIISTGANSKISGSATSTGSFGALDIAGLSAFTGNVKIGTGTVAATEELTVDSGTSGQHTRIHIEKTTNGGSAGISMRSYDASNTWSVYSTATSAGDLAFYSSNMSPIALSLTKTGDAIFAGDNAKISGSATSTGSFGRGSINELSLKGARTDGGVLGVPIDRPVLFNSSTSATYGAGLRYSTAGGEAFSIATVNSGTNILIGTGYDLRNNIGTGGNTPTSPQITVQSTGVKISGSAAYGLEVSSGNISGSATSTGSFGRGKFLGHLAVGAGATGTSRTLDVRETGKDPTVFVKSGAGNAATIELVENDSSAFAKLQMDGSSSGGDERCFSIVTGGNTRSMIFDHSANSSQGDQSIHFRTNGHTPLLTLNDNGQISGSAASTGSFGSVSVGGGTLPFGRVAINGANANVPNGPHIKLTTDSDVYPLFSVMGWQHDNISLFFDSYYDGATRSSDAGSNFRIHKNDDKLKFLYDSGVSPGSTQSYKEGILLDASGNVEVPTGNIISSKANGLISGSLTSTGSFGHVKIGGSNIETFISSSAAADGFGGGGGGSGTGFPFDGQAQITGSLIISGAIHPMTASLHITDTSFTDTHVLSQSLVVAVDGNNGRLFSVTDQMSGSLFSANTVAGLPVIEAFSDNKVTLGPFSNQTVIDSDGNTTLGGSISGSLGSTGSFGRLLLNNRNGDVDIRNSVDGAMNVVIGDITTGAALTSGTENVIIGPGIAAILTGENNVYIGSGAAGANNAANNNTVIGYQAMSGGNNNANNTVIGFRALNGNNASNQNVAVGYEAGKNTSTGGHNVFMGYRSGDTNTTGETNVTLGSLADVTGTGATNQIALGYNITAAGNNQTAIGNSDQTHVVFGGSALISGSAASTGSFGQVKGDIIGQRPIVTHIADFSASMDFAGRYNIVHGGLTCSILTHATTAVDNGTEYEFFQTSSLGNMLFETGSGVSLYVKNDNLNIAGQYSGASLKKVATNTWHLVGDLT